VTGQRRRLFPWLVVVLVLASCGDAATTTTTDTTTTTAATTTTEGTTTTNGLGDDGYLTGFLDAPVEDPLLGSGFHTMAYGDDTQTYLVSVDPLQGTDPQVDRLGIGLLDPPPATSGVADDQRLVGVWVDNWSGDIAPTGVAFYTVGADGWGVYAAITSEAVLAYLETTADYTAKRPDGPPVVQTILSVFEWAAGTARFIADVAVFDYLDADSGAAFEGEIECTLGIALECELLSDDGVLRPGDEGEEVSTLQSDLAVLGYFPGVVGGIYDDETVEAVRLFQRDYRLGVDGKAGPQTLGLLADVVSGESDIVMVSQDTIGDVGLGTLFDAAYADLVDVFGTPNATDAYESGCTDNDFFEAHWDGFTAFFTDRDGPMQLDGWFVDDMADVPSWLYFVGGIKPSTTWAQLQALGAGWEPAYGGVWYQQTDLGYGKGGLDPEPGYPNDPAASATVTQFGTGTGAFVDC